jgi:branched-chain amino acid transport system substrate-binding protein
MVSRLRTSPCAVVVAASLMLATGAAGAQEVVVKVGVAAPLTGSGAAYCKELSRTN